MTRTISRLLALALILFVGCITATQAQTRLHGGVKSWYATWDLKIDRIEGATQTDYSPAFMTGPYLTLRVGPVAATVSYSTSLIHFASETRNPGLYEPGYNQNRELKRDDINIFLTLSVTPEIGVFLNAKFLNYEMRDAIIWINQERFESTDKFTGKGFGGGVQVSVPFTNGSPLYSYVSVGGVYNTFNVEIVDNTSEELLYYLDAGVGFLAPGTRLGLTLGIRGEHGGETKTIIGPAASIFYRLL